jgi:Mg/Co/Ni transporter MgtE
VSVLDSVTGGYLTLHPAAAARTLARLDNRDVEAIFDAMPRQIAATVLEHMAPGTASRCLTLLSTRTASEILSRTPILTAVAALRVMKGTRVDTLLAAMPRATAARLRLRLRFSESVVGAFVDEDVLTLTPDHRVGDALRLFRRAGQRTGQTIPILDEHRLLAGLVDLGDLLAARDRSMVQRVMHHPPAVLNARAPLQTVTGHTAWLTHDSLPVINRNGVFQGVLRRSRVIEAEQKLLTEVAERNEFNTTRAALADIFWMGVGAIFVDTAGAASRDKGDE